MRKWRAESATDAGVPSHVFARGHLWPRFFEMLPDVVKADFQYDAFGE